MRRTFAIGVLTSVIALVVSLIGTAPTLADTTDPDAPSSGPGPGETLRVTVHHNRFANVGQRAPRVRFGQVDVYDNYFYATDEDTYSYSWGIGVFASVYAENNLVLRSGDIPLDAVVFDWRGTAPGGLTEVGSMTRVGTGAVTAVSFLDAYNATHEPDLPGAGWVPALRAAAADPTDQVQALVTAKAGAGKLGI